MMSYYSFDFSEKFLFIYLIKAIFCMNFSYKLEILSGDRELERNLKNQGGYIYVAL